MSYSYESELFSIIDVVKNQVRAMPLFLGGVTASGGGGGGPPGGFIGRLPQTRVAYDLSELALPTTPVSGASLLDNLNHIRYRLGYLEDNQVFPLIVEDTEVVVVSGVVTLNFEGFTVTDDGGGQVTITTSGGTTSLEIQQDDSTIATAVNTINFEGATVTDDSNGKVTVTITVSGSIPSSFEVQKDDITVATDVDTLNFEGATVTDDGSGKVTITVTASGDMFKSIYDTDDDGVVDSAETVEWLGVLNAPAFALSGHTHTLSSLDDVNIPAPEDSQVLSYNAGTEKWESVTLSGNTGASTFLDLSDTPDAYTGQAGKSVVVNSTETGLEFTTISGGSSTGLLTPPYKEDYTISATTASGHFGTTYQYISNALELYYNGVKVLAGDYTIDEDYQGFSLAFTTYSGDYIEALYYTTSGNLISGAVPEYLERMAVFTVKGTLAVETGLLRVYNETDVDLTITDAIASVGVAPSSSITQLDIKKNGISIMTSPLEIGDGQYKSYTASGLSSTTWAVGEYLTVDIIQTGNAEDLTVQVVGLEDASVAQVINANMLEGKHSDDFAIAGHTHPAFELTVEDEDQEISVNNVSKIVFPENMVVDGGNGIVNITLDELPTYALTVETQDQSPVVLNVDRIKVPNGSLTDEGGGVVSLDLTVGITDFYAFHKNVSGEFLGLTEKVTAVSGDLLVIEDSDDSYKKKYTKIGNLSTGGSGGFTFDESTTTLGVAQNRNTSSSYTYITQKLNILRPIKLVSVICSIRNANTYTLEILDMEGNSIASKAVVVGGTADVTFTFDTVLELDTGLWQVRVTSNNNTTWSDYNSSADLWYSPFIIFGQLVYNTSATNYKMPIKLVFYDSTAF